MLENQSLSYLQKTFYTPFLVNIGSENKSLENHNQQSRNYAQYSQTTFYLIFQPL